MMRPFEIYALNFPIYNIINSSRHLYITYPRLIYFMPQFFIHSPVVGHFGAASLGLLQIKLQ